MIWHYFPIGFRFPVSDFSDTTKKKCWKITASALLASGGEGAVLYDAQENYDYGSDGPVYTCIACFYGIKQSRAVAKKLYSLDALMTQLCLLHPFVQANYLESYGPYPILGKLVETGIEGITDAGKAFLPDRISAMETNGGLRILIASEPIPCQISSDRLSISIGCKAASLGFRVNRKLLSVGNNGVIRAIVTAENGRYETVFLTNSDGERITESIGILPSNRIVIEANERFADIIVKALDLGYRRFYVSGSFEQSIEDPRISQCEMCKFSEERSAEDVFFDMLGFETAAKQSDVIALFVNKINRTSEILLDHLHDLQKPTILMTADASTDTKQLMQKYSVLRDVVICSESDGPCEKTISESFSASISKMTGKAVVKLGTV